MNLFYDRKQIQITNSICDYSNGNLFPQFPEAISPNIKHTPRGTLVYAISRSNYRFLFDCPPIEPWVICWNKIRYSNRLLISEIFCTLNGPRDTDMRYSIFVSAAFWAVSLGSWHISFTPGHPRIAAGATPAVPRMEVVSWTLSSHKAT